MATSLIQVLPHLMRPLGGGIPTFSAGSGAAFELQKTHYSLLNPQQSQWNTDVITKEWKKNWDFLSSAELVLIGVPSDTGAGIRRGAAYGPRAVRSALLKDKTYQSWIKSKKVIDLGDIYVNPHLLYDELLNDAQIKECQRAMYADAPSELQTKLPVSALTQLHFILTLLKQSYAHLKFYIIGGDHSVAWPVTQVLADCYPNTLGIVQPDAHTDLLESRLGVKYCFGTWSFHASNLIGRNGKLVQLGIRQTAKDKSYWESTTGVKQFWADDVLSRPQEEILTELITHLQSRGVKQIYFSNDIDGTDEAEASATGTPAPGGLSSEFFLNVIKKLAENFEIVAADIMEVAPDLARSADHREQTLKLAARYSIACIKSQVSH